ncbi:MAG: hypothetical protein N3B13_05560, partial [Deltaproteobacteria bacterium]|nr:hypothetical protein [Deltaproteobacteria bacterium]
MVIRLAFKLLVLVFFLSSCGGTEKKLLPYENFSFPVDLVYDNKNELFYVVSSNFDLGYKYGNVKAISINNLRPFLRNPCKDECKDFGKSAISGAGISIGDYAGISVYYNNKIFIPLRKDNKIAVVEADGTGGLSCGDGERILGC